MSAITSDYAPWSKRRWCLTVLFVLVLQYAAVVWLSQAPASGASTTRTASAIRLLSDEGQPPLEEWSADSDPTLFALAHPLGFSGRAWMQLEPFPYRRANWVDHPQGLRPDPAELADNLAALAGTGGGPRFPASEKILPQLYEVTTQPAPLMLEPKVRVEGDLAGWRLISSQEPPGPEPGLVHSQAEIQIAVNARGQVVGANPVSGSGSAAVDRALLDYAKRALFDPPAVRDELGSNLGGSVTFGRLILQWVPKPAGAATAGAGGK